MITKQEDIIIWQKWIDPFGEKEDENSDDLDDFYDEDSDEHSEEENFNSIMKHPTKPIKVIATPMGIIQ